MNRNILLINNLLSILLLTSILLGCSSKQEKSDLQPNIILNGLYKVEYVDGKDDFADNYIWIFSDDMMYILYPGSDTFVNYEAPAHYFIENNQFYSCGIDKYGKAVSLTDCKKDKSYPKYKIVKIDTIVDNVFNEKKQVIDLKWNSNNELIKITKYL